MSEEEKSFYKNGYMFGIFSTEETTNDSELILYTKNLNSENVDIDPRDLEEANKLIEKLKKKSKK